MAVVVAETLDQAEHAASLIKVEYETERFRSSFERQKAAAVVPPDVQGQPSKLKKGDAEKVLTEAEYKVDNVYRTPRQNHAAIEPHVTLAVWDDDGERLTVFEPTQGICGNRASFEEVFGLGEGNARVISPFVGGGFGSKAVFWWITVLCAAAAKVVGRPLKSALSRAGVFRTVGGRTLSEQRVALAADSDGKLRALVHDGLTATNEQSAFQAEPFSHSTRHLYAAENYFIGQKIINLDQLANTFMRAPGDAVETFALESAMDELAYELKIDPIHLRRINEPEKDPTTEHEFSMRNLSEAYRHGAEKFGWQWNAPRSQRGKWLIGQGAATAFYPYFRLPGTARVRISADGTATVSAAAQEMGMGTATVQIQHAAERLGLPIDRVAYQTESVPFSARKTILSKFVTMKKSLLT